MRGEALAPLAPFPPPMHDVGQAARLSSVVTIELYAVC